MIVQKKKSAKVSKEKTFGSLHVGDVFTIIENNWESVFVKISNTHVFDLSLYAEGMTPNREEMYNSETVFNVNKFKLVEI